MFDKLFDILRECFWFFVPFVVIRHFERGVLLRYGILKRRLEPGFHWVYPFNVDEALKDNIAPRTKRLEPQTLVTWDGRGVSISAVILASIYNIEKAMLDVESVDHALVDSCYGPVAQFVRARKWAELMVVTEEDFEGLRRDCHELATVYGIKIHRIRFADFTPSKTLRLMTSSPLHFADLAL